MVVEDTLLAPQFVGSMQRSGQITTGRASSASWSRRFALCAPTPKPPQSKPPPPAGESATPGARAAIQEARTTLKLSWRCQHAFEEQAAQLYSQSMDIDQMREFAAELLEVDKAHSRTAARNRSQRAGSIVKLWTSSPTVAPIGGTRWAAYNAVTEYVDHYAKVRTSGDQAAARALRAVTIGSAAQTLKARAFRLLQTT
jgi:Domain of unknown function (DUF932)